MVSYQDPRYMNPTYPNGSPPIDVRLATLERDIYHERKALEWYLQSLSKRIDEINREIGEIKRDRAALIMKVEGWFITSLVGALGAVVWIAWQRAMGVG